jgi:trans-aconitate methyltransferase
MSWAKELIARFPLRGKEWILDVGCGDGKITAELAATAPHGGVTGIDSSPEMIRHASSRYPKRDYPNLHFIQMDARHIRLLQRYDIVFSNAVLHWVDDHPAFLRGASSCLRSGGRLVVSCGGKGNAQDVFVVLRTEMRLKRWRGFFHKLARPYFFHSPEEYRAWLPRFGFQPRALRLADKDMVFDGREKFTGWFRTTWLPYTQRVPESSREEFIAAVVERYIARHPIDAAGRVHVRMMRLEIEAARF